MICSDFTVVLLVIISLKLLVALDHQGRLTYVHNCVRAIMKSKFAHLFIIFVKQCDRNVNLDQIDSVCMLVED